MVSQGLSQLEERPESRQTERDPAEMIQDEVDEPRTGDTAAAGADMGEYDQLNEVKL